MLRSFSTVTMFIVILAMPLAAWSQDAGNDADANLEAQAAKTVESAKDTANAAAKAIDESAQAQEISAGILNPIYQLAEAISFPAFHWIGFAIMVAGVVSFALQLTIGKLVVLARAGFSPSEILSDALGLVVSLVGLVLTTQAAAENSNFTGSASAVLTSTACGVLVGFVFYIWGQRQELQAVEGRRRNGEAARPAAKSD